jgi:hypothetical protein
MSGMQRFLVMPVQSKQKEPTMKCLVNCLESSKSVTGMLLAVLFSCAGARGHAETVTCVIAGDTVGLQTALAAAESNGDDDIIELQAGDYTMPTNFPLSYNATSEGNNLTIEGGYGDSIGNPCGAPPATPDARPTIIHGGTLFIHMALTGSVNVRSITVENMFSTDPNFPPVYIGGYIDFTGSVTVQHAIFRDNASTIKSAVYVFSAKGPLIVQDSVFVNNESASASESPVHMGSLSTSGAFCALIINSTFANNISGFAAGLDVHTSMCNTVAANDIFWGSALGAVHFENPQWTYLASDDFDDLSEAANAVQAVAIVSADPMFYPDYSLHDLSPLRDKGSPGGFVFSIESSDVAGHPRVNGTGPDIGAFETYDVIFASGFEP